MSDEKEQGAGTETGEGEVQPEGANPAEAMPGIGGGEAAEGVPWSEGGEAEGASGDTGSEEEMDPVEALEAEVEKWKELALRNKADLENFRKRMNRERQDAMRYANSGLLETLLPILDNFEMGLDAARSESEESMIFRGMEMVSNQFRGFLEELGVTEVEAEGKPFDPNAHEAVAQEASEEVAEGEIVRVMRRGFRLRDRLLRAPAVVVSTGAPGGEGAETPG